VSGHDFSRAAKAAKSKWALAPEGTLARQNDLRRDFIVGLTGWRGEVMEGTIEIVSISGAFSILAVIVTQIITYYSNKKRDHEADWRKIKLEQYKEYIAALSGTVHHPYDSVVQRRYTDAVNSMGLIAPPKVLIALYGFLDETSFKNVNPTPQKYDSLLSSLMRAMREDSHPKPPKDSTEFIFRTLDCPPDKMKTADFDAIGSGRAKP
jgi:hypothetical protein